jgi:hypothetical protein
VSRPTLSHINDEEHYAKLLCLSVVEWHSDLARVLDRIVAAVAALGLNEDKRCNAVLAQAEDALIMLRRDMGLALRESGDRRRRIANKILGINESRAPDTSERVDVLADGHLDPQDAESDPRADPDTAAGPCAEETERRDDNVGDAPN